METTSTTLPQPVRRVLLVAFHYPPEISGGAPRHLIMQDFLVRAGCRVLVLTPRPVEQGYRGSEILRVPLPSYLQPQASGAQKSPSARRWISGAARRLARRWLLLPDVFATWSLRAARSASAAYRAEPFDLVITSSPQESVHLIGRRLKRQFGCPWLADFRDGWTFESHRCETRLPIRRWLEAFAERSVVAGADWITAATRPIADDFRRRFPRQAGQIHFLPTGFEERRYEPEGGGNSAFRLVYTGRFSLSRKATTPRSFLVGLRQAMEAEPDLARRFRLVLVGDFSEEERSLWSASPLAECVEDMGQRPYDQAMRIAAGATMLLLVTPPGLRSIATRKLFDYLAVRRPVFALAEGNEAARILEETRAGLCVPPDDVEAIARGLCEAFASWRAGALEQQAPCSGNDRYLAEPHFTRVLGNVVLPALGPTPQRAASAPGIART